MNCFVPYGLARRKVFATLDGVLLCTVRHCGQSLARAESRMICPRGHSFDIARSGYVNLLQPQDKRSSEPGDTADAVTARRRLHDRGLTQPLATEIIQFLGAVAEDNTLDVGCGEGFYLGSLAARSGCRGSGVDISIAALDAAARRYKGCEWVVANADRFIPWADGSFSLLMSITGRSNPREFSRVLREDGRVLVGVAAPDDLIELRGAGRDRVARTVEEFRGGFSLSAQRRITTSADLDASGVEDVLLAIYRPIQKEPARAMKVTFSLDLMLFEKSPAHTT